MGDFCMRFIAQIFSFMVWIVGTITSIMSKISPIIDDSISLLAGIIGLIGGVIWITILILKRKETKISLQNEILENLIKKKQLETMEDESK